MKSIVKQKLKNGQPVLVNKINFFNSDLVEMIGLMGFDCIWICSEHAGVDYSMLNDMVRAARISGMDCVVRTAEKGYDDFNRFLEMGIKGLMIPHVADASAAEDVVSKGKFQPVGNRGIDGVSVDSRFGLLPVEKYIKTANDETFIVVQIEDQKSLSNVEAIADVEGIDVLFVGPGDLSLSMGFPGQVKHPEILKAIDKVASACKGTATVCGTPMIDSEHGRLLMDKGVKYFTGLSDFRILSGGFRDFREKCKKMGFSFREEQ